jgi:hypothetical protein
MVTRVFEEVFTMAVRVTTLPESTMVTALPSKVVVWVVLVAVVAAIAAQPPNTSTIGAETNLKTDNCFSKGCSPGFFWPMASSYSAQGLRTAF